MKTERIKAEMMQDLPKGFRLFDTLHNRYVTPTHVFEKEYCGCSEIIVYADDPGFPGRVSMSFKLGTMVVVQLPD